MHQLRGACATLEPMGKHRARHEIAQTRLCLFLWDLFQERGITPTAAAKTMGMDNTPNVFSKLFRGETSTLAPDTCRKVAEWGSISLDTLLTLAGHREERPPSDRYAKARSGLVEAGVPVAVIESLIEYAEYRRLVGAPTSASSDPDDAPRSIHPGI
jgi:transcriptional regulator with XRE-family HTH domain